MTRRNHELNQNAAKAKKEAERIAADLKAKRPTPPAWAMKIIDRNQKLGYSFGC